METRSENLIVMEINLGYSNISSCRDKFQNGKLYSQYILQIFSGGLCINQREKLSLIAMSKQYFCRLNGKMLMY